MEAFAAINKGMRMLEEVDPNVDRFTTADRLVQDTLACYREIQTIQSKLDIFLKKLISATALSSNSGEPVPSTSSEEHQKNEPPSPASSTYIIN